MRFIISAYLLLIAWLCVSMLPSSEASVPPRSGQPHTDTFIVSGYGDLQQANAVTQKAKATRVVTYGYRVASGCIGGSILSDFQFVVQDVFNHWHLQITRDDNNSDLDIVVNCGNVQIANCGSVTIFCVMGKPFYGPFNKPTASISDILNTYPVLTRHSILCHEVCGHAILTWNEQYCLGGETIGVCRGAPQFTSTPNWADIMNTGPESRHDLTIIEDERADRTLYAILLACSSIGYDECTGRWRYADGWSWEPSTGIWYDPLNRARFGSCNADQLRLDMLDTHWWRIPGVNLGFDYSINQSVIVPVC